MHSETLAQRTQCRMRLDLTNAEHELKCLNASLQEAGGDRETVQELQRQAAAARKAADVSSAEVKALRKHARSLEKQLKSARAGASLDDIRTVAGRDSRLVRSLPPDA